MGDSAAGGAVAVRRVLVIALLLASATTPLVAHALGTRCWIYLPAHVPVLLAGLTFERRIGSLAGVVAAATELAWGGRGVMAALPTALELACYGAVSGACSERARTWRGLVIVIVIAMIVGRLAHLVAGVATRGWSGHELTGLFVDPWPGIALQLLVLPLAAAGMRRALRITSRALA